MNDRLINCLKQNGIEALIVCRPDNVAYLTGYETPLPYNATESIIAGPLSYAVADVRENRVCLITLSMGGNSAPGSFADEHINLAMFDFFDEVDRKAKLTAAVKDVFSRYMHGAANVGAEGLHASLFIKELLAEADPGAVIVDATDALVYSRTVKQLYEIERIKRVCEIEDAGQRKLNELAKAFSGETEFDIYTQVLGAMYECAGKSIFVTGDFATGPRTNDLYGVYGPISRKIERGDSGIFDMSLRFGGYWCDCANTVVFGKEPNDEQLRYFEMVKAAFDAGFDALRPGNTLYDADKAAADAFRRFGKEPVVYTGHQIGCNVCDFPMIIRCADRETKFEENMVVCIEPQNYTFDGGKTGVRLERVIQITKDGPVALNSFPWGIGD